MRAVLAVDLGTTGIKAAVVDADGRIRSIAGEVIPLLFVDDVGVEQDPQQWWQALGRCARRAVHESSIASSDVDVVAITSQYSSTTPVNDAGLPLGNTIMWIDGRGPRHRSTYVRDAAMWLEMHGLMPSTHDPVGHVDLIRATRPEVYDAAHAFVEPMDHLAARLTGRVTATQNTMFPMLACDNRTWGAVDYSDELLAMSGLSRDKLATLVPMGEPRGPITSAAAAHLGVSPTAIVAGATIDSVTSAVGTGAITSHRCGLIIGTTTVMATHLPSKRHDIAHGLTSAPSPLPASWLLVAENGVGGKALDVFVNNLVFADDGLGRPADGSSYTSVLTAAADVPCGSNGVMFLPWLIGSMAPAHDRHQRGGFVGIGLSTTRADMARAVLEGVAMNAAWLLPSFSALAGCDYPEVTLGGGGARSPLWGQILADAFGVPVRRLAAPDCTNAHGAALLALAENGACSLSDLPSFLVTSQVHEPDQAAHRLLTARTRSLVDFHASTASFYRAFDSHDALP